MSARKSERGSSETPPNLSPIAKKVHTSGRCLRTSSGEPPYLTREGTREDDSRERSLRSPSQVDTPPPVGWTPTTRVLCEWPGCQHRPFRSQERMTRHIQATHLLNQDMRTSQQIAEEEARASQASSQESTSQSSSQEASSTASTSEDVAADPAEPEVQVISTPLRRSLRKRSAVIMEPPRAEAVEQMPDVVEIRPVSDEDLDSEDDLGPVYKTPIVVLKGTAKEREMNIMNNPPPFIFTVKETGEKLIPLLEAKIGLSKRKLKEEYCLPCLDFKLTGGRCSREHDEHGNDDRMQEFWLREFPHDPKELTKQIVLADLEKIVAEWN